ncbi:shikimate dehydrogenase [Siccirubricoccus sp. KC 17139]|uniref:Shikimate dehydrogenase n=1 Tax=Siccirubricoccus soli TaxID=2899147 RepID=A0ABT1DCG5_9PROT|nr:shikimate dehydrogenase [Siccirubricoccus soli]MCO6419622.1 shikimate dehydrogenase [Siccirubricoccus soli]MCP2685757.1 shikimate dehydrogenase [Siccirubricoccus soli]
MLQHLDGATRLFVVIGDPIAQVKAPAGITAAMAARGRNAVLVPLHVTAAGVEACLAGLARAQNLDGIVVTVPHKFTARRLCATVTERADFLGSVNIMRRGPRGGHAGWHGDMTDGLGFLGAIEAGGFRPQGKRALQVGAGGAGTAIALALLEAGLAELALHDADAARRDALLERLRARFGDRVRAGSADPAGYDLAVNATPAGMRPGDPLPLDATRLEPTAFVGDVITVPEVTPLLAAARARGCATSTGVGMFDAARELMVDFLLGG